VKIHKGKKQRARRVLIYGENGVGKSTIASRFPNPLFLNLEDGLGDIDCDSTEVIKSVTEFDGCLIHCAETEYQTIVVDTVDWLEKLIFDDVAKKAGKDTIDDIGFGKGYQAVELAWREIFKGLGYLWNQGRHIVFTCHEMTEKLTNPEGDSYNYWRPSLHTKGSGLVTEWCDEVLFVRYKTHTVIKEEGFGRKRAIGIGGKERVIICNKTAAVEAKNRLGMPDELPHSFEAISQFLPLVAKKQSGNISGVVVEGTSKVESKFVELVETPF
jgi:hypothetical protein